MTRDELNNMKYLKREIEMLEREIQDLPVIADCVTGSMTVFPYIKRTITIEGVDVKKERELKRKLSLKLERLQNLLLEMEDWLEAVDDSEMRIIMRLRYRNGLTWQQVAFAIGEFDESYPRRKHNKFMDTIEKAKTV